MGKVPCTHHQKKHAQPPYERPSSTTDAITARLAQTSLTALSLLSHPRLKNFDFQKLIDQDRFDEAFQTLSDPSFEPVKDLEDLVAKTLVLAMFQKKDFIQTSQKITAYIQKQPLKDDLQKLLFDEYLRFAQKALS
ncbi:MAG: hypothetical protein FJZ63_08070 [Chlamydiae bacterium]|nr:hypothetical protein [Chlamydiota bacterium]